MSRRCPTIKLWTLPTRLARLNSRKGLLRDATLAFIVRSLGAFAAFFMSVAVTRTLPAAEAGNFFLGITMVTVLASVLLMGLNNASLRFVGAWAAEGDWSRVRAFTRTSWQWLGASTLLGACAIWLAAPWLGERLFGKPPLGHLLQIMAPSLVLMAGGTLVASQLQAIRRVTHSIVVLSIGVPVCVGLGLWVNPIESVLAAGWLYVSAGVLTLSLGLFWWHRFTPTAPEVAIDRRAVWNSCMPLWIVALMGVVASWASQLIAGIWVSSEDIAHLAVAQRTANLVSFVLAAVNFVVAPRFAALYHQGRHEELRRLALRSVRLMSVVALPVVLGLCLLPGQIMGLFGTEYSHSAQLLVILALGQLVNVMTGSVGYLLTMSGHERDMRTIVLLSGPFAVLAALVLVPLYGVTGAAVATALAVAAQNLGAVRQVSRRLGFNTLSVWT